MAEKVIIMAVGFREGRADMLELSGNRRPTRADFRMLNWDANSRRLLIAAILLGWFAAYKYFDLL